MLETARIQSAPGISALSDPLTVSVDRGALRSGSSAAATVRSPEAERGIWLLEQEARALLTRLELVKPFVLQETMVPAAALMPSAQVAIDRYLMRGRRALRAQVRDYLQWLAGPGRQAPVTHIQRRFIALKLHFHAALSQLDLFAEAISQRSEQETGVWLAGLDVAAQDALTLPGRFYHAPPVVCHLHRGLGGAIRRARTRLPGGGMSPVAVVRIPRERMIGYGIASSLVHECGHQGAALLGLVESLRPALQEVQRQVSPRRREAWVLWERWISEVVADLWAIAKVGIASTLGLIGIVSLPRWFVFRVDPEDPHLFPWIRVRLSCALGDALYPHRQWRELAGVWDAFYSTASLDPRRAALLQSLSSTLPDFVRFVLAHRPPALRGLSLGQTLRCPQRTPARLLAMHQAWRAAPARMFQAPPTMVFAALGCARAAARLSPEEENRLLRRLITHWALHSTLDLLSGCGDGWRPVSRVSPPGEEASPIR